MSPETRRSQRAAAKFAGRYGPVIRRGPGSRLTATQVAELAVAFESEMKWALRRRKARP